MASRLPRVTIGMPVYNGATTLRQSLASLLRQTFDDFELIINDNASQDETEGICREFASQDSRVRYFRNAENKGPVANFQRVLTLSNSQYFMWAAHDDIWESRFVGEMVAILDKEPTAALAFSRFDNVDTQGDSVRQFDLTRLAQSQPVDMLAAYLTDAEEYGKANLIYGLMRRELLLRSEAMKVFTLIWGADMHTVFRILSFGSLKVSDKLLFHKRLSEREQCPIRLPVGEQLNAYREELRNWDKYWGIYRDLIKDHPNLTDAQCRRLLKVVSSKQLQRRLYIYYRMCRTRCRAFLPNLFNKQSSNSPGKSAA